MTDHHTPLFTESRPALLGLAYRLLGSYSEAEDAVHETYLRWRTQDLKAIDLPAAWLKRVCTRYCLDQLKSARLARTQYVGTWLPEPLLTQGDDDGNPQQAVELSRSLTTAFLLTLERLAPRERAAFLLYSVFDQPYPEVAETLGVSEAHCRKIVSRAKQQVSLQGRGEQPDKQQQQKLLDAFEEALSSGQVSSLSALLAEDVRLSADGGGVVPTIPRPIQGAERVLRFIGERLRRYWQSFTWQRLEVNGFEGMVVLDGSNVVATVSVEVDAQGHLAEIYIVRNPQKLARIAAINGVT